MNIFHIVGWGHVGVKSYHVTLILRFPDCAMTSTKIKFRGRSFAYLTMYILLETNELLRITAEQNSQRQESFNNTDHHGPLKLPVYTVESVGRSQLAVNWPTRGRLGRFQKSLCLHQILKLYGSTANKYTQVDLNHGTYRRQNRRLKVVLVRIMNAFIKYDARL